MDELGELLFKLEVKKRYKSSLLKDLIDYINKKDSNGSFFYTKIIYSNVCKN
jgi:hypothetical protein